MGIDELFTAHRTTVGICGHRVLAADQESLRGLDEKLVELLDNRDGTLSVVCTMVDHDGAVRPEPDMPWTGRWLAGMHRELAGNEPWRGFTSTARGDLGDRNVDLRLPAPFPLT